MKKARKFNAEKIHESSRKHHHQRSTNFLRLRKFVVERSNLFAVASKRALISVMTLEVKAKVMKIR
jgi:hypothetical protein